MYFRGYLCKQIYFKVNSFSNLQSKLVQFVKKYYTNELIKGGLLFFTLGALYIIFILLIEHVFWLNSGLRTLLFWVFISVELVLLYKFVAIPLAKLFNLKKGISFSQASKIIGEHFPEVSDKLLNVLQLNSTSEQSDLLLASIEQKSNELQPIPFKNAVNYKTNVKYVKYALIPVLIVTAFWLSGKLNWFSDSYTRVVNYNLAYEPSAPFKFFVLNTDLNTIENKPFTLKVETAGTVVPETISISYNNETYFLERSELGVSTFTFNQLTAPITFRLSANGVTSRPYTIQIINAPQVVSFDMILDYPAYTGKTKETLKSIGNAVVPEGTQVTWEIKSANSNQIQLLSSDTLNFTQAKADRFNLSKRVYNPLDYTISSSNTTLKNYENLSFNLKVLKDQFPELNVQVKTDSLDQQTLYFYGKASDDYGLKHLQLVYFPIQEETKAVKKNIPIASGNFSEFLSTFPQNLPIESGKTYEIYFEVFDNGLSSKSTKSSTFTYRKRTESEETDKQLQDQNKSIDALGQSIKQFKKEEKSLESLSKTQKEKSELKFSDKKKLNQFLERQLEQKKELQQINKSLQKNLDEFKKENIQEKEKDAFKEDLKKRLKENEAQVKKDEKLLEELRKLQEKFSKEEFTEKLDELAKKAKSQKRSLEQILEMTKRYYVKKKLEQISEKLDDLAKQQDELSKKDRENTQESQEKINKAFNDLKKELDQLEKDNKDLKSPLDTNRNENAEDTISEEQKEASEALEENESSSSKEKKEEAKSKAKKKQKSAAQQMKKMSMSMKMNMQSSAAEQMEEDREMLRQILDNLLVFSFNEEENMTKFSKIKTNISQYTKLLKTQNELKNNFEHIDDSLFALSLRQPLISEKVNTEIENIYFNIDKALARFSENDLYQGVGYQQYAITSTNTLADLLSDTLDAMDMQMGMPSPGSGEGGMPLPDIIISQEELAKKMEKANKKGKEGKEGKEGDQGQEGEQGEKGESGKDGKEGQDGEQGENGSSGNNGSSGKNGKSGKNGMDSGKDGDNGTNGKDGSKGKNGKQGAGNENGLSEEQKLNEALNGELFQIYQEQQQLREALDKRLEKDGLEENGDASRLLKDMEGLELDLLNNGITDETVSKMKNIKHQLLKLEKAVLQQAKIGHK